MFFNKKTISIVCLVLVVIAAGIAATILIKKEAEKNALKTQLQAQADEIIQISGLNKNMSFEETIDHLRVFINDNSMHRIDEEYERLIRDLPALQAAILDYAKGTRAEPPHLECSSRSSQLERLYQQLGYKTRTIVTSRPTKLGNHTFIEVQNPATGEWHSQDPDLDIYWHNKNTKERVSVTEAMRDFKIYEPCGRNKCGWDHHSREGIDALRMQNSLQMVSVIDRNTNERFTLYKDTIDPESTFQHEGETGTFCEVLGKNCRNGFIAAADYVK